MKNKEKLSNIVVINNFPSNMIKEAIIIFKKENNFELLENEKIKNNIIEEAEDTIIDYIKKSENKAEYREYKVLKNKYKVLKYFSIFILILNLISIILFYK
ncbi:MAG: hypothetical protein HFJ43_01400 [Clostridia bacterium]|nr:hypothetical protein [Clostridia bacterium]